MNDLGSVLPRSSFEYFCKIVLKQKLGDMHKEWIKAVLNSDKHVCIMSARGHFKTTILSIAFPLWTMMREPNPKTIVILSATLEQSTEIMGLLKRQIEDNQTLREVLYPENIHSTKWSETQIRTKNGHRVLCLPFGDTVRGKHPNYCICDDVLKSEIATDSEDTKRVFYGVVYPIVQARRGKLIVVGTPVSYTDLLQDLSTKPNFTFLRYPAVVFNDDGSWNRPQFPEHFDLDQLKSIKETMPSHLWSREYLCNPASEDTALFPQEVLNKATEQYERTRIACEAAEKESGGKNRRVIGCDIAVSQGARADFSVFSVLDVLSHGDTATYLLRDQIRKHLTAEENVNEIRRLYKFYNPARILVEKTGVGWGVAEACMNDSEMKVVALDFDTKMASREKILSRLEVTMRNGGMALPKNDILLSELSQFAYLKMKDGRMSYQSLGEHDDCVMSLAIALEAASTRSFSSMTLI
jgi:phage terminase large subunit-like protein